MHGVINNGGRRRLLITLQLYGSLLMKYTSLQVRCAIVVLMRVQNCAGSGIKCCNC